MRRLRKFALGWTVQPDHDGQGPPYKASAATRRAISAKDGGLSSPPGKSNLERPAGSRAFGREIKRHHPQVGKLEAEACLTLK